MVVVREEALSIGSCGARRCVVVRDASPRHEQNKTSANHWLR